MTRARKAERGPTRRLRMRVIPIRSVAALRAGISRNQHDAAGGDQARRGVADSVAAMTDRGAPTTI